MKLLKFSKTYISVLGLLASLSSVLILSLCASIYAQDMSTFKRPWKIYSCENSANFPSLKFGDYFLVNQWSQPRRGDLILFYLANSDVIHVRRLIGLPGDKIKLTDNELFINDARVEREKIPDGIPPADEQDLDSSGSDLEGAFYHEKLPDSASDTIYISQPKIDPLYKTTAEMTIPADHWFVLGDNRNNALDSRVPEVKFGFVSIANYIGKADYILLSPSDPKRNFTSIK